MIKGRENDGLGCKNEVKPQKNNTTNPAEFKRDVVGMTAVARGGIAKMLGSNVHISVLGFLGVPAAFGRLDFEGRAVHFKSTP
jgi:hypothetical protein